MCAGRGERANAGVRGEGVREERRRGREPRHERGEGTEASESTDIGRRDKGTRVQSWMVAWVQSPLRVLVHAA